MSRGAKLISFMADKLRWISQRHEGTRVCPHGYYPPRDGVCAYCLNVEPAFIIGFDESEALGWIDWMEWHPQDVLVLRDPDELLDQPRCSVFLVGDWGLRSDADEILDHFISTRHITFFQINQFGSIHQVHRGDYAESFA